MLKTEFARKLDSTGRLVIPSKLRDYLGMETGQLFTFYIQKEEENGDVYLCVKCPSNKIKFTFSENAD